LSLQNTTNPAEVLANRVWFTRKAWIHAEKRLLQNEYHTQLLMVVYAAYTTCLSVVLLVFEPAPPDKKLIDTSLAVLSIVLLALSLYLNSKSFKDRAARFKIGYHDLQHIESKLQSLVAQANTNNFTDQYDKLSDLYTKSLRDVENHDELDDIRSRITAGSGLTSRRPTRFEIFRYFWWICWRTIALTFFYITPVIAVIWFLLK
jgi:hypothetical protein